MEPGRQMRVTVELVARQPGLASFKGKGESEGQQTVSARVTLATYNLAYSNPALKAADERIVGHLRGVGELLCRALPAAS
jgi:hypothetical protein